MSDFACLVGFSSYHDSDIIFDGLLSDTVLTFPGARMPWEALVQACKELNVLSLIDGAHGIGHIDLGHLGEVGPDFFVSNCYK